MRTSAEEMPCCGSTAPQTRRFNSGLHARPHGWAKDGYHRGARSMVDQKARVQVGLLDSLGSCASRWRLHS